MIRFNRTYQYLLPVLMPEHGELITRMIKKDQYVTCTLGEFEITDKIHFVSKIDTELENCRKSIDYYITEFEIPERFQGCVELFIKGQYSKMYTSKEIKDLNIKKIRSSKIYKILTRDETYIEQFIQDLKKHDLVTKDVIFDNHWKKTTELDIPPKKYELQLY